MANSTTTAKTESLRIFRRTKENGVQSGGKSRERKRLDFLLSFLLFFAQEITALNRFE